LYQLKFTQTTARYGIQIQIKVSSLLVISTLSIELILIDKRKYIFMPLLIKQIFFCLTLIQMMFIIVDIIYN